ncbi:MAG TPA: hypothetical protein VG603_08330, partial [Chitinophagales bacterium]|nr:hypothetical protein [Chitinophagales bacterium]
MEQVFAEWAKKLLPWVLTHGVKIVFTIIGLIIVHKVSGRFIAKIVRIAVVPDRFTSKQAEKKREDTLIRIFTWTSYILIWIMGVLMILDEIGVPIGPILT